MTREDGIGSPPRDLDELDRRVAALASAGPPVRGFLPELIKVIWDRTIDPGKVFDLTLRLEQAAEGYKAMDERRATKVLLTLWPSPRQRPACQSSSPSTARSARSEVHQDMVFQLELPLGRPVAR